MIACVLTRATGGLYKVLASGRNMNGVSAAGKSELLILVERLTHDLI